MPKEWIFDKRILHWFDCAERRDRTCLTKRVMITNVDGRGPRGKLRFG